MRPFGGKPSSQGCGRNGPVFRRPGPFPQVFAHPDALFARQVVRTRRGFRTQDRRLSSVSSGAPLRKDSREGICGAHATLRTRASNRHARPGPTLGGGCPGRASSRSPVCARLCGCFLGKRSPATLHCSEKDETFRRLRERFRREKPGVRRVPRGTSEACRPGRTS